VRLIFAASVEALSFPLLEVENLSTRFGDSAALTSISFSVRENEVVGVIGTNGSGKTTLLECFEGLLHADSGTIAWQKTSIAPEFIASHDAPAVGWLHHRHCGPAP
jgi:ABC-type multidrug transport system ATPase subunit